MRRPVNNYTLTQRHGGNAPGTRFGKHLGSDYGGPEDREVLAPVTGVIVQSYLSGTAGNVYEIQEDGTGRLHRLMHLKTRPLAAGTRVSEGQVIARSGGKKGQKYSGTSSTGPHVHWDVRKAKTMWDASFDNYYNPETLVTPPPASGGSGPNAGLVGKRIQLLPRDERTTFRAGTTTVAGKIRVTDNSFVYLVRGIDPKFPNRVIINSVSAGGDGVALALQYVNGQVIPGWKVV